MFIRYFINLLLLTGILFTTIISGKDNKLLLEKSFNVLQNQTLTISADGGDVELVTWNKNEVLIQIFGNKKAKRNFGFDFSQNENGIRFESNSRGHNWFSLFHSISIYYKIFAPEKFNVKAKTSGGDISISTLTGNMELRTSGGDIKVVKSMGKILSHTSGGDIKIVNCKGNTNSVTSGGDIDGKNVTGNFFAKTSGGDISASIINGKVETKTSGGDITIMVDGENKGISASTSGGDISVHLSPAIKADINLHAVGGDINNNLENVSVEKASSSKFYGKLNGGGNLIKCKTLGGDIDLKNK